MLKALAGPKAAVAKPNGFARHGVATVLVTAATMALGLLTGILVARSIGPEGRGALTAVLTTVQMLGWLFAMGCGKAVTYTLSRDRSAAGRLLSTWTLILLPLAGLAIGTGYLLLPLLLAAQPPETLELARHYLPVIAMALLSELMLGLILGDQDFRSFNALTFLQPAGVAAVYVALWAAGRFTVEAAVIVQAAMSTLVLVAAAVLLIRRHGLARPDPALGRQSLWYALRTHGDVVGGVITQRLDLLIIPAFLSAAQVGLYALATSLSWLIVSLSSALATVVMPAATRRGRSGRDLVLNSLQATFAIGGLLGGGLFVFADIAIGLVYGPSFADSALPLRLLLPGAVLYAAAAILLNGLYAENRPFTATLANLLGMAVTLGGLLLFLHSGGILAAAIVSTVAYTLVFAAAAALYRRATGLPWRVFLPDWALLSALPRRLLAKPSPVAAAPADPAGK
ncbi:oligosaccharide flippase family protein [Azospirillum endophyticum]